MHLCFQCSGQAPRVPPCAGLVGAGRPLVGGRRTSVTPKMGSRGASGTWENQPLFQKPAAGVQAASRQAERRRRQRRRRMGWRSDGGACKVLCMQTCVSARWGSAGAMRAPPTAAANRPSQTQAAPAPSALLRHAHAALAPLNPPAARLAKPRACCCSSGTAAWRIRPSIATCLWRSCEGAGEASGVAGRRAAPPQRAGRRRSGGSEHRGLGRGRTVAQPYSQVHKTFGTGHTCMLRRYGPCCCPLRLAPLEPDDGACAPAQCSAPCRWHNLSLGSSRW